jgi:hypothetical protein
VLPNFVGIEGVGSGRSRRYRLGFSSSVENLGRGPLLVRGSRSRSSREMVVEQLIRRTGAGAERIPGVGLLRYVRHHDHRHWHYLRFERYELRRAADHSLVAPDQKTGFCLGDRYDARPGKRLPGEPRDAVYTGLCGRNRPDLETIREGISVGYGDDYPPQLEGQYIDVTGIAAGRYELVHRVNTNRRLQESRYANNAASVLIRLRRPGGPRARPVVSTLARCPDSARCKGP